MLLLLGWYSHLYKVYYVYRVCYLSVYLKIITLKSFSIVKETINLLLKLKSEENLEFDEQTLFIQLLASLNGYISLLNYGIVSYDSQYVIKTVENLIQ